MISFQLQILLRSQPLQPVTWEVRASNLNFNRTINSKWSLWVRTYKNPICPPYTFMGLSRVVKSGSSWSLEEGPTASSMFEYHCPMCVKAIISSPVWRCRIGRSTPKTAKSARLGFDPPAFIKPCLSGGNRRKKFLIPPLLKHGLIIIVIDNSVIKANEKRAVVPQILQSRISIMCPLKDAEVLNSS